MQVYRSGEQPKAVHRIEKLFDGEEFGEHKAATMKLLHKP